MIGGDIAKAGEIVEVTTAEAKDLLARGKAVVATADDAGDAKPKHSQATEAEEEAEAEAEEEAEVAEAEVSKPARGKK